ncbi:MAG: hypothetical protein QM747_04905 [Nocardioides sp.]
MSSPAPKLDWEQPLAGKTALVTGASRGIGAAIATVWPATAPRSSASTSPRPAKTSAA